MTDFLHVANGTSTTRTLEAAGLPGRTSIWADPLYEGPVPAGLDDDALLAVRAAFIGSGGHGKESVAAELRRWRQAIDDVDRYDELVLWYEHDLFDQLNLVQILTRLSPGWPKPVTLICIGSYPGRPHFMGLGELTTSELAPLFESRQAVTPSQRALAHAAWAALRSPDPTAIEAVLATDTSALPYIAAALERHLEELPSTRDGQSRSERRLLEIASAGPIPLVQAFPRMHDDETAFYITDTSLLARVEELSSSAVPLLALSERTGSERSGLRGSIELTPAGRAILAGADRVARYGIDRWLGGVHLTGKGPLWRWDERHERVVWG
ncbi:MAG: hypothetical protein ABIX28_08180 [Vicinamibacterales bacterium]